MHKAGRFFKKFLNITSSMQHLKMFDFREGFSKKCSGRHNHQELSGKVFYKGSWGWGKAVSRTKLAAKYPTASCKALAKAVRKSIA